MTHLARFALSCVLACALAGCGDGKKEPAAPDASKSAPAPSADMAKRLAAYDKGLDFLASKQNDGIWSVQGHPHAGFTAIALTPFIERPGGVRDGDKAMVAKSLPWIASELAEDGGIKSETTSNYETSVVIMALAASKDPKYKPDIDRAAKYIKSLQFVDEKDASYGGIGYGDDGKVADLLNTQYALAALTAAGVPKDDPLYQKALQFVQRSQNRKENETPGEPKEWTDPATGKKVVRGNDGGAVYAPGNGEHTGFDTAPDGTQVLKSYGSMTYALLRCYHMAGLDASDGRVKAAVDWISKNWVLDKNPGMPAEQKDNGRYYYYTAIGKTLPEVGIDKLKVGGRDIDWRAELSEKLLSEQKPNGMWINAAQRWMEADPVLATSYALAALAPCVR